MQTLNPDAINQLVNAIVQEVDPQEVILFGSHARGDARPDSDVDLMVIEQEPFSAQRSRRAECAKLSKALREFPNALDILLYSRAEFDYWKDSPNHVVGRALREGRVIHVRP
ncbi:MAG: nucleotidyltransferase domain-containing protein [Rhodoferax sp.]|nr:nucleotidyltransferase domain-containing protein [Rhodoferax sp.]